jgi:dTDP-4-dehydrorhamnose 3,5-epimerase
MIFQETTLKGAFVVEVEKHDDERGFFARSFCAEEFESHGLCPEVVQANLSYSKRAGTLRGLHYQIPPASEPKFIRCIRGAVWDVIVDLRPDSPTYLDHFGVELTSDNRRAIYVPDLFAHGNQSLVDDCELLYLMGEYYTPGCARGLRYDDPELKIDWPVPVSITNAADREWPLLTRNP